MFKKTVGYLLHFDVANIKISNNIVIYRSEMEDQTVVFNYASNLYMSNHWISMKLYIKKTWLFFLRQGILYFASVIFDNVENPQRNYNCCIREVSSPINFHQPDCAIFFIEKNKCINVKRFWKLCIFIQLYQFYLNYIHAVYYFHSLSFACF